MKAFSVDLRKRVVAAIDEGMHVNVAVETFKVSRRVIYEWLALRRTSGSIEPKSGYQNGHSHKITDWEEFEKFAAKNNLCTVQEMVVAWAKLHNTTISKSVIKRALKKIGYTSKKKLSAITNLA